MSEATPLPPQPPVPSTAGPVSPAPLGEGSRMLGPMQRRPFSGASGLSTDPRLVKPTAKPRRVYNGVKLESREAPALRAWAAQRIIRTLEQFAPGAQLAEGYEYARLGQARTWELAAGFLSAKVQGRMPRAYNVAVRCATFPRDQWETVLDDMGSQARYAAGLLSGELSSNIEDLFGPRSLRLFPSEASDLALSCDCAVFAAGQENPAAQPGAVWCKHICCALILLAERLGTQPLLIFKFRGLAEDDLIEGLRKRRAAAGAARGGPVVSVPVFSPHVPALSEAPARPLAECVEEFWSVGRSLEDLDLPMGLPEVSHPLLRRLGPSPFADARFPLVGLLATCYDIVGESARRQAEAARPTLGGEEKPDAADSDPDSDDRLRL